MGINAVYGEEDVKGRRHNQWVTPTGHLVTSRVRWRAVGLAWRRFLFRPPLVFVPVVQVALLAAVAAAGVMTWACATVIAAVWVFSTPAAIFIRVFQRTSELLWHPNPVGGQAGGVMCSMRWQPRQDRWELGLLAAEHPSGGAGTWMMRWVCAQADSHGRTVTLRARTLHLIDYYRGFGFESRPRRPRRMARAASPNV